MGKVRLDQETADRMLAGVVDPADVPPGFEAVAELLQAARAAARCPVHATGVAPAAVDPGLAATQPGGGHPMLANMAFKPRISILAAAVVLTGMTGAAYAAGLPGAASGTASAVLQKLGISAPGPKSHPTRPTDTHGSTVSTLARTTAATGAAKGALISATASAGKSHPGEAVRGGKNRSDASGHGKGAEISALAHTTTATGAAKGATISAAASDGKSHAGQHGHGASGHGGSKPTGSGHGHGGHYTGTAPG
jgi:hypothetical protein